MPNYADSPASSSRLSQLLPGVPPIESPFFAQYFSASGIDDETRRIALELHTKGYAILDFPEAEIATLAQQIRENLHPRFDFNAWKNADHHSAPSLRVENAWEYDDNVRRIACNAHIIALLTTLYGRQAWPFQTLNFPVGSEQHYHTDSVHFSSMPERFMCGVWLALEDVDAENGALEYFPGSHQWPIYTNEHIGRCVSEMTGQINQEIYEDMWRAVLAARGAKAQRFYAKQGQALIWAANLMHGGSPHLNRERTRWSQVTHYFFDNCAYYTPMASDPAYGNTQFRQAKNIVTGEVMPQQYAGFPIELNKMASGCLSDLARHGFDSKLYLAANPDVAQSGINPYEHFLRFGYLENRKLRP